MDTVSIKTWGNSNGIRIPKKILDELDLKTSDEMTIEVSDGAIVLRKVYKHKTLEERMAGYKQCGNTNIDYDKKGGEIV